MKLSWAPRKRRLVGVEAHGDAGESAGHLMRAYPTVEIIKREYKKNMITVRTRTPRPILLIVVLAVLLVSAEYITPQFRYGLAFSFFLLTASLILNYVFAIRESIILNKNILDLNLEKYKCKIFIDSIQSIQFNKRLRILSIDTHTSQHTFKIIGFEHKAIRNIVASISCNNLTT